MSKTFNGITVAALTAVQGSIIKQARAAAPDKKGSGAEERKQIKREVFGVVKEKFGIDPKVKVMACPAEPEKPDFLVLHVAGKRNPRKGQAFRLNASGKWDGTYVTKDQLFPPPVPAPVPAPATSGSVFGGTPAGKWFRLDPAQVALVLTAEELDELTVPGDTVDMFNVARSTEGGALPTPHLMLYGRTDLAITADGSIYRML